LQLRTKRILATSLFAITEIVAVAFGMRVLFHDENMPGCLGAFSQVWPAAQIERVKPLGAGGDWDDKSLRRSAEAIPGVKVVFDPDCVEARRFGAETSGHTFLFGADGRLLFNGGITASRGRSGNNAGERAMLPSSTTKHRHEPRRLFSATRSLTAPKWSPRSYV
jgi:hypothetical protein